MAKAKTPTDVDLLACFELAADVKDLAAYIKNTSDILFGVDTDVAASFAATMTELGKDTPDRTQMLEGPHLSLAQNLLFIATSPQDPNYSRFMKATAPLAGESASEALRNRAEKYFKNYTNPGVDNFVTELAPDSPSVQAILKKHLKVPFEKCMTSRRRSKQLKILAVVAVAALFAIAQAATVAANFFGFVLAGPLGSAATTAISLLGSAAAAKLIVDLGKELWEDKIRPDLKLEKALAEQSSMISTRLGRIKHIKEIMEAESRAPSLARPLVAVPDLPKRREKPIKTSRRRWRNRLETSRRNSERQGGRSLPNIS